MTELEYRFTNDTLFKMLFVKYPVLLKRLVAQLLRIPFENIHSFQIRNPEMPPETWGEKFCRLDINMDVNGQRMDLEVQVGDEGDYEDRCLYYWARAFSSALPAKGRYRDLPRTIVASIVAFKLFDCEEYYSEYMPMEVTRHTLLTDKERIIVFELPKLPKEVTADNGMELWLSLFRAKTVEELDALERMGVPEVQEAIHAYRDITVTPEFREAERLRSKARHDEAQAVYTAEQRGRQEGESSKAVDIAKKMLRRNRPLTEIIEDTGLTREEVEGLRQ